MNAEFNWNGGKAFEAVLDASWQGLTRAVVHYHTQLREALNVPNTGVYRRGKAVVYPNPSKPGEPPRKRTGWLQKHVRYELDRRKLEARVGVQTNAFYGVFLELGTRRMAARPWLLATLRKQWPAIKALAEGEKVP